MDMAGTQILLIKNEVFDTIRYDTSLALPTSKYLGYDRHDLAPKTSWHGREMP